MGETKPVIKVNCFVVGAVQTNFYFLYREGSPDTIVFDPADLGDRLYEELDKRGLKVKAIFLTHAHFDHIMGLEALKEKTGAPVYACIHEKNVCESEMLNASMDFGHPLTVSPDHYLEDNEEITVADITLKVLHTPGHTKGSICFLFRKSRACFTGDFVFNVDLGRTDLNDGSEEEMRQSILNVADRWPGDMTIYPGHSDSCTMRTVRKINQEFIDIVAKR